LLAGYLSYSPDCIAPDGPSLPRQAARERELRLQLEEKAGRRLEKQETYQSLQAEADKKTKKLRATWAKLEEAKRDVVDMENEFAAEREELQQTTHGVQRELKLWQVIIEHFIPKAEVTSHTPSAPRCPTPPRQATVS